MMLLLLFDTTNVAVIFFSLSLSRSIMYGNERSNNISLDTHTTQLTTHDRGVISLQVLVDEPVYFVCVISDEYTST